VAARGIDLPDLDLVIHADLPKNTEALLHRSGRTGRAGRKGASVLMVPYSARRRTERLLQTAGISARWGEPPGADAIKQRDDARLLADPSLEMPPTDAETQIVAALLERYDPTHVAAAFVRLARQGQASPEDLAPAQASSPGEGRSRSERASERSSEPGGGENFVGGAWVALSVGRAQSAEPRWLIPMLCKAGGLTKRQLGTIRIHQTETHVEIDANVIDAFLARTGEGGRLEKSIFVRRMEEPASAGRAERRAKPPGARSAGPGAAARAPRAEARPKKKGAWRPED
jgi:ATP-dependent RNA helicase DeaD